MRQSHYFHFRQIIITADMHNVFKSIGVELEMPRRCPNPCQKSLHSFLIGCQDEGTKPHPFWSKDELKFPQQQQPPRRDVT
jgi:hypothetical protein